MGLGITQALLQHGYCVVANSRNISKSKDLKPSSDLILVDGDIGKMDTAIKVTDAAIKHFDRIDLLANCAGIYIPKPFHHCRHLSIEWIQLSTSIDRMDTTVDIYR